jgi:hypothetical protein
LISFGELTDFAEDKALMKAKKGEEGREVTLKTQERN